MVTELAGEVWLVWADVGAPFWWKAEAALAFSSASWVYECVCVCGGLGGRGGLLSGDLQ